MARILSWLSLLLLPVLAAAQAAHPARAPQTARNDSIVFWNMSPKSVDVLLKADPQPDALRLKQLKQTFSDLQCRDLHEQAAPEGKNLVCTLPAGKSEKPVGPNTILFVAHYEHTGPGQSAVENWSGALMLPFLFHALSAAPRHHTFLFAEVDGERGADALYNSFTPAQRRDLLGVVALDALGLGPPEFFINPNDTYAYWAWVRLGRPLLQAAADQRFPAPEEGIPGGWFKDDVTRVFRHHNAPAIVIHSVDSDTRQVPGSVHDTAAAIDRDVYRKTLTLLSDYAAELDRSGVVVHRKTNPLEGPTHYRSATQPADVGKEPASAAEAG